MRVILTEGSFVTRGMPQKWEGGVVYQSLDDLTVGPVDAWPDRRAFERAREQFWLSVLYAPLAGEDAPGLWTPLYPNVPFQEWPELTEDEEARWEALEDVDTTLGAAEALEVWHDDTVQGIVFLAFAVADLKARAIGVPLRIRCLPTKSKPEEAERWIAAALADPGGGEGLSEGEATRLVRLWEARCALPAKPTFEMESDWQHAFAVLAARYPEPETGLSALERTLLGQVPDVWGKMALIVAKTMALRFDLGDRIGDRVLHDALERMALRARPLVEVRGDGIEMRFREARLTQAGRDLLQAG